MPYEPALKAKLNTIFNRFADEIIEAIRSYDRDNTPKALLPAAAPPPKAVKSKKPAALPEALPTVPIVNLPKQKVIVNDHGDHFSVVLPTGKKFFRKRERDILYLVKKSGYLAVSFTARKGKNSKKS